MAQYDQTCQAPADRFKVPTLLPATDGNSCDRTDYTDASKLNVQTSEILLKETERLLRERKLDNLATLSPQQMKERGDVETLVKQAYDWRNYQVASPSVVRVDTQSGTDNKELGSGFTVGAQGNQCWLVTDYHVVQAAAGSALTVQFKDGKRVSAAELIHNEKTDLAIMSIPTNEIGSCPALPMAARSSSLLPNLTRTTSIGHPAGSIRQFISGGELLRQDRIARQIDQNWENGGVTVSVDTLPYADLKLGEVKAQVIGGNSGGPTMADGKAIGVVQSKKGKDQTHFTPIENVHTLIAQLKEKQKPINSTPKTCDMEEALDDIKKRIAARQLDSAEFNGLPDGLQKIHRFKDGVQYTIHDKRKTCEVVRKAP
jgi:Trypsin-like serine proteases, typically periplasmic, contain C-terminal PDZ domain